MKHPIMFSVVTTVATLAASAQDWARPRLENSPRHLEWVKVKNGSRTVNCFIAYPEVKGKATAVIVIHEIFGLTDWVRSVADELAEAGYIAIAPDLLSGTAPGGGGTPELGGGDAVRKAISSLPAEQITADLNAVKAYVSKLPASNGKVAVGGFCWGGTQTFRYATNDKDIKAAFVFYGTGPMEEEQLARINCPVYGFYGGNDARVTSTVEKSAGLMKKAGKAYEPVTYEDAGHGFMRAGQAPDANAANKKALNEGWRRWKELLSKI
ncbi:MAG TPA: dienelactone hydrolase family protein [Verrucomicrobiae bacterium]